MIFVPKDTIFGTESVVFVLETCADIILAMSKRRKTPVIRR